jgi:hypothetical protein
MIGVQVSDGVGVPAGRIRFPGARSTATSPVK